ncbi:hypothetical protein EZJ19_04580 [Parasulfuritortus cantonensis]|uniref:Nucleotidyltransferase n=1 Tax=Parasulfuritortus cantonensis TaxID=2528202 RepID=A0A4V2NWG0_9PROT|nr:hypothetical protein [Parasulfuritortus cantonensis]TCJ17232.1 hypothetical protein EZJ19_04580 [Parasulfuritortus cantonensis]
MPRDGQRNQHLRQRVAQLAAQLMMEHGINDHAQAKRKAARQLGLPAGTGLPSNEEVDSELRLYASLYETDLLDNELEVRQRQALEVMETLAAFQPRLVGGLAQGIAARHGDIELEVYADSSKEFEQFLLNADIEFKSEERRGGSFFNLFSHPADVQIRVLPVQSMQSASRNLPESRRRLTADQLRHQMSAQIVGREAEDDEAAMDVTAYPDSDASATGRGRT